MVSREMTWGCSTEDDTETSELLFLQIGCKTLILLRFEAISLVLLCRLSKNSRFNWTHVESNPTYLRGHMAVIYVHSSCYLNFTLYTVSKELLLQRKNVPFY